MGSSATGLFSVSLFVRQVAAQNIHHNVTFSGSLSYNYLRSMTHAFSSQKSGELVNVDGRAGELFIRRPAFSRICSLEMMRVYVKRTLQVKSIL